MNSGLWACLCLALFSFLNFPHVLVHTHNPLDVTRAPFGPSNSQHGMMDLMYITLFPYKANVSKINHLCLQNILQLQIKITNICVFIVRVRVRERSFFFSSTDTVPHTVRSLFVVQCRLKGTHVTADRERNICYSCPNISPTVRLWHKQLKLLVKSKTDEVTSYHDH